MYKIELDPVVEGVVATLPAEALGPLAELHSLLEVAPWSGQRPVTDNPDANMLTHTFGERGLAVYLVLEDQRRVYLVRLQWL